MAILYGKYIYSHDVQLYTIKFKVPSTRVRHTYKLSMPKWNTNDFENQPIIRIMRMANIEWSVTFLVFVFVNNMYNITNS